jgi:hypothetical protein
LPMTTASGTSILRALTALSLVLVITLILPL